jgi:hypothetical protein
MGRGLESKWRMVTRDRPETRELTKASIVAFTKYVSLLQVYLKYLTKASMFQELSATPSMAMPGSSSPLA